MSYLLVPLNVASTPFTNMHVKKYLDETAASKKSIEVYNATQCEFF